MKVLIAGSGKSGRSAYDFLFNKCEEIDFVDENLLNSKEINEKELDRLFQGLSFIVTSPGLSLDVQFLKEAEKRKIEIVGEFELGCRYINGDIISVTGTNGKTTTVSLINYMLKSCDKNVYLGGNIGVPITSFCEKTTKDDISVLECSSYQLETVKNFHSRISVILNFGVDHLIRHKTLENYISCKQKIVINQTENDYLILNADSELLMENIPKTKAKIFYFSTKTKVVGCYLKRGCIYFNDGKKEEKLLSLKDVKLIGEHNISNILAASLAVYLETHNKKLFEDISGFNGIEHRIEYVKTVKGVSFFNDSKATNISSTIVATKSFKSSINLILGGSDKGYEFDELFQNLPKNVKNIAIFGEVKHKIAFSAKKYGYKNFEIFDNLKDSVLYCFEKSKDGYVVLLSPACASFDQFSNFEERGNIFKKIVREIALNENVCAFGKKKT